MAPRGERRVSEWKASEKGLISVDANYKAARNETEGQFLCGEHPTFADFTLASILQWCKAGFGPESEEWKEISSWQDRRWEKFLFSLREWE